VKVGDELGLGEHALQLTHSSPHQGGIGNAGGIAQHDGLGALVEIEAYDLGHGGRIEIAAHGTTIDRASAADHLDAQLVGSSDNFRMLRHGVGMPSAEIQLIVFFAARDHQDDLTRSVAFLLALFQAFEAFPIGNQHNIRHAILAADPFEHLHGIGKLGQKLWMRE
jgi:hypothetical protein